MTRLVVVLLGVLTTGCIITPIPIPETPDLVGGGPDAPRGPFDGGTFDDAPAPGGDAAQNSDMFLPPPDAPVSLDGSGEDLGPDGTDLPDRPDGGDGGDLGDGGPADAVDGDGGGGDAGDGGDAGGGDAGDAGAGDLPGDSVKGGGDGAGQGP